MPVLGSAAAPVDPLVLRFDGPAQALQNQRFAFDLQGDGSADNVPLLAQGWGYLALDRNQNGRIDDGLELFGPRTDNGFAELAALDDDGNGWIDEGDAAFKDLRIWRPSADGGGSLQTLQAEGVGALGLANAATPFALRFKGVGFFPPRGLPRVVWAGVERSEPLQVLQRKIVTRLFQLGLEPDNRRFSPHLTLARLGDTPPAKVGRWLEHNGLFAAEPFTVDRFLLYSSVLGRKGASHTVEQEYLLGG